LHHHDGAGHEPDTDPPTPQVNPAFQIAKIGTDAATR
jgi:hypothetical protein